MKEQLLIGRCCAKPAPALKSEAEALGGAQRERHDLGCLFKISWLDGERGLFSVYQPPYPVYFQFRNGCASSLQLEISSNGLTSGDTRRSHGISRN